MPLPKKIKDLILSLKLIPHPEGGFFIETWRSGSVPMTTMGQTALSCENPDKNLVIAKGRAHNRADKDERRNALTSIFWVPAVHSPRLHLTRNCSDHVHYYQGGIPFRYYLYDPSTGDIFEEILGPELHKGHKLQVCVKGGLWKCGIMVRDDEREESETSDYEYTLIGEAVAPGFDFHDFDWVTEKLLRLTCKNDEKMIELFLPYVFERSKQVQKKEKTVEYAAQYYEGGERKEKRIEERS